MDAMFADRRWLQEGWTTSFFVMVCLLLFYLQAAFYLDMRRYYQGKWDDTLFLIVDHKDRFEPEDEEDSTMRRGLCYCAVVCLVHVGSTAGDVAGT
eukprot:2851110-Amphidinium_carterae.1